MSNTTQRRQPGPTGRRRPLALLVLLLLTALAGSATVVVTERPAAAAVAVARPNIVLITADDMRLDDLRWMPQTKQLIRAAGATVPTFISNHPMCCPARAEILSGRYGHNSGVRHNVGPYGGYSSWRTPGQHLGRWLKDAGYRTAIVGKFLNGWERAPHTPPGWNRFNPTVKGIYKPFDIRMWHHGKPRSYSGTHTSDLMGRFTTDYIRSFAKSGAPFFIWCSQVSPHDMLVNGKFVPPVPALRHRTLYQDVLPPSLSDPAFNEDDVSDKPPSVRASAKKSRQAMITLHRARIRSLRSVDDQVKAVVDTLRQVGQLNRTFIFFLSDNGYLIGEHRLVGKNRPYEQALRVPLVVRGPGIPAGAVRPAVYSMVDLAPTFLQIAQAKAPLTLDGRSMLATLRGGTAGYGDYLIQGGESTQPWWWRGVRSPGFVYARYTSGFEELYDRKQDPHQLRNAAKDPAYADALTRHRQRFDELRDCTGATCSTGTTAP
jgi:N-acetylglucosamine-6-sulfatase